MEQKPLLVLFDGNAIAHRAYHAFEATKYRTAKPLTVSRTGEVVSAVYGFAQMLLKVLNDLKPTHFAVAFDMKGPTFRHDLYDKYKAQRPPTADELIRQMGRVRELVDSFNIPVFEVEKYEADDVLGTLSKQAAQKGIDTVIVTGDADTMQLVSPHVKVFYPKGSTSMSDSVLFGAEEVKQKFGVGPEHVADYKAMVGDPSDNIRGVKGIGEKTAVKLIGQFGAVEDIYKHLDEVEPPRVKELLKNDAEGARRSKELATIVTDVPVTLDLDDCRVSRYDRKQASEFFREMEFFSLLPKLPGTEGEAPLVEHVAAAPPAGDYRTVASPEDLDALVGRLAAAPQFAFDTETTGLEPMRTDLVGLSFAVEPGTAYYIPVGHKLLDEITQLPLAQVIDRLKPVMEDAKIPKLAHNAKFDMMVLAEQGVTVNNVLSDTMIAAHLIGEKSVGLKALSFNKLGVEMTPIESLIGSGAKQTTMAQVDIKTAAAYSAADADMTLRLDGVLKAELEKQSLMKLFTDVEMPLIPVLLLMERNGVAVDTEMLHEMSDALGEQIKELEKKIYEDSYEFNINSPQQLGRMLSEKFQIAAVRRGKDKFTTDASVLETLVPQYPIVKTILEYRQLTKIKSTYIDTLPELVNPKTGRIHTSFNQTRTSTGRLSSTDPNMQNIPVRGELGGQVRQAFIAGPGASLLAGDYSQIDLRALAHLSGDPALVSAFRNDEDIHAATASLLFGVEKNEVTRDMRRFAKTVNFGVIYGMSGYGLEQATELSREEAGKFIKSYFEKYPGVRKYLDDTKEKARKDGYVSTLLGRRRYMGPEINSANRQVREAAERMAINMPVQGTSADIIKIAMINLYKEMARQHLASKMLLQVHDELVFEVPDGELEVLRKLVTDIMDSAVKLNVPLKVDTKVGKNWGEMK